MIKQNSLLVPWHAKFVDLVDHCWCVKYKAFKPVQVDNNASMVHNFGRADVGGVCMCWWLMMW
jgi:hypothetical protein